MYTRYLDPITGEETDDILRAEDGALIPSDPANSDYQVYLQWRESHD